MIIGEAPGGAEDAHGQPFLGTAGKLLESLLAEIALRREDVYLANVVMCRPLTDRQPASDRRPRALEIAACASYLDEQIRLVRPRVIVALGATATQRLIGRRTTVTSARRNEHMVGGARLVPTFHPSPLSINRTAGRRAVLTADFRLARELLGTT